VYDSSTEGRSTVNLNCSTCSCSRRSRIQERREPFIGLYKASRAFYRLVIGRRFQKPLEPSCDKVHRRCGLEQNVALWALNKSILNRNN